MRANQTLRNTLYYSICSYRIIAALVKVWNYIMFKIGLKFKVELVETSFFSLFIIYLSCSTTTRHTSSVSAAGVFDWQAEFNSIKS